MLIYKGLFVLQASHFSRNRALPPSIMARAEGDKGMIIKIDIEYSRGHSLSVGLWNGGAIWVERAIERDRPKSIWRPDVEKDAGEYRIWWRSFYAIFTPPGYKPQRLLKPA